MLIVFVTIIIIIINKGEIDFDCMCLETLMSPCSPTLDINIAPLRVVRKNSKKTQMQIPKQIKKGQTSSKNRTFQGNGNIFSMAVYRPGLFALMAVAVTLC